MSKDEEEEVKNHMSENDVSSRRDLILHPQQPQDELIVAGTKGAENDLLSVDDERQIMILMLLAHVCSLHDPTPRTFIVHVLSLYEKGLIDFKRIKFLFDLGLISSDVMVNLNTEHGSAGNNSSDYDPSLHVSFAGELVESLDFIPNVAGRDISQLVNTHDVVYKSGDSSSESWFSSGDEDTSSSSDESSGTAPDLDCCKQDEESINDVSMSHKNNGYIRKEEEVRFSSRKSDVVDSQINIQLPTRSQQVLAIRNHLEGEYGDATSSRDSNGRRFVPTTNGKHIVPRQISHQSSSTSSTSWSVDEHPLSLSRYQRDFLQLGHMSSGSFGDVYLARNKLDGNEYAIKKVEFSGKGLSSDNVSLVVREVECLANCNHPNCVRYFTSWLEPTWAKGDQVILSDDGIFPCRDKQRRLLTDLHNMAYPDMNKIDEFEVINDCSEMTRDLWSKGYNRDDSNLGSTPYGKIKTEKQSQYSYRICLYIQMELCTSKTLSDWIQNREFSALKNDHYVKAIQVFKQILEGLSHIHSRDIIHRDLKPSNIFESQDGIFKIGDFGLSKLVPDEKFNITFESLIVADDDDNIYDLGDHTKGVGTISYAAPEQINGSNYDSKTDIYSLGLILLELVSSFSTQHERMLAFKNCKEGKVPEDLKSFSPQVAQLILSCTSENPNARPCAMDILRLPFLNDHVNENDISSRVLNFEEELRNKNSLIEMQAKIIQDQADQIKALKAALRLASKDG